MQIALNRVKAEVDETDAGLPVLNSRTPRGWDNSDVDQLRLDNRCQYRIQEL